MSTMNQSRHPSGTTIGGQWAPGSASEIDLDEELNINDTLFEGVDDEQVFSRVNHETTKLYEAYGWGRRSIINGWAVEDVEGEVICRLYEAKARGSLDRVRSHAAFTRTTVRNTVSEKLLYAKMRSYDRKLSRMGQDRVDEIESAEGRKVSVGERKRILENCLDNWDRKTDGPPPGRSAINLILGTNERLHMGSVDKVDENGQTFDIGEEGRMGGVNGRSVEDMATDVDDVKDDLEYVEATIESNPSSKSALRLSVADTLRHSYGAPETSYASISASKARDTNSRITAVGGADDVARRYQEGQTDPDEEKAFFTPWSSDKELSASDKEGIASMISGSGDYGKDVWKAALDSSNKEAVARVGGR